MKVIAKSLSTLILSGILTLCCSVLYAQQPAAQGQQGSTETTDAGQNAASANANVAIDSTAQQPQAPAVVQKNTSGSGSPAVMSADEGSARDGTGNVQRAGMNMAGAAVGNLGLDKSDAVDTDIAIRRDQQARMQHAADTAQQGGGNAAAIGQGTRRSNNAASDQNLSSKDKNASQGSKDDTNEKAKGKKKKNDKG